MRPALPDSDAADALLMCIGVQRAWSELLAEQPSLSAQMAGTDLDQRLVRLRNKLTALVADQFR